MVKLDRIYTGGGDAGETSLVGGARAPKDSARIAAIGDIDEANAVIGLARRALGQAASEAGERLARIQNDLFDVGADLATPGYDPADGKLRIQPEQVAWLEREIDAVNESLSPLTSFVLPGGGAAACWLHLARTVVRRAERTTVTLAHGERISPQLLVYLNRLSDLLFVLARAANDGGQADVLWRPGLNAGKDGG